MTADVMASNSGGMLVRNDGTNTYEGTATLDGRVYSKKFRCTTREEAIARWEAWQRGKAEQGERRPPEERGDAEVAVEKSGKVPPKMAVIRFSNGRTHKIVAAFADSEKALRMASALDAALEVSGSDGKYDVDEVEVWG